MRDRKALLWFLVGLITNPAGAADSPPSRSELEEQNWRFFLEQCGKPGVVRLVTGACAQELTTGNGDLNDAWEQNELHFSVRLPDGTPLKAAADQSGQQLLALQLPLMIGWEAERKMSLGSIFRYYIPADLAFGAVGSPDGQVAPHTPLTMDVTVTGRINSCPPSRAIVRPRDMKLVSDPPKDPNIRPLEIIQNGMDQISGQLANFFSTRTKENKCLAAGFIYVDLAIEGGKVLTVNPVSTNIADDQFVSEVTAIVRDTKFDTKDHKDLIYYAGYPITFGPAEGAGLPKAVLSTDNLELKEWAAAVQKKVKRNWMLPPMTSPKEPVVKVGISFLPNGYLKSVSIVSSSGDPILDRSVELAVRKSDPLPPVSDPYLAEKGEMVFQFVVPRRNTTAPAALESK